MKNVGFFIAWKNLHVGCDLNHTAREFPSGPNCGAGSLSSIRSMSIKFRRLIKDLAQVGSVVRPVRDGEGRGPCAHSGAHQLGLGALSRGEALG